MRLLFFIFLLVAQQDEFTSFRNSFPDIPLDENGNYLTRSWCGIPYFQLPEKYDEIPVPLSLKYLLGSDSSQLRFKYYAYNYDTDVRTEESMDYKHFAVGKLQQKNFDLMVYSRYNSYSEKFILGSFDKSGNLMDTICVNRKNYLSSGPYFYEFRFSLISPDSIKTFNYGYTESPNQGDKKTSHDMKVVITDHVIDDLGKFSTVAVDSMLLSKSMIAYERFNDVPVEDDPVRKYWTSW